MKKFKFTLDKLMDIKEQQLKQQKEKLGELRKIQRTLEEEKAAALENTNNVMMILTEK